MQTVDGEANSGPDKSCVDSTINNSFCKRAPPFGRRKLYTDMKGEEHENEEPPEKCETIYEDEECALPARGGHEQKARCEKHDGHVHYYSFHLAVKKDAIDARVQTRLASNDRMHVQSAIQKYIPSAIISDP